MLLAWTSVARRTKPDCMGSFIPTSSVAPRRRTLHPSGDTLKRHRGRPESADHLSHRPEEIHLLVVPALTDGPGIWPGGAGGNSGVRKRRLPMASGGA